MVFDSTRSVITWEGFPNSARCEAATCTRMSLSKLTVKWLTPMIGEEPHHPAISFTFPQCEFGQKTVTSSREVCPEMVQNALSD